MTAQQRRFRWDKRKKKYVQQQGTEASAGQAAKRIKTESGAVVAGGKVSGVAHTRARLTASFGDFHTVFGSLTVHTAFVCQALDCGKPVSLPVFSVSAEWQGSVSEVGQVSASQSAHSWQR